MKHTVITIARSYGSGGRTLGKLLAKELGIHCYDRELLRMASEQSGINEALFGQVDEKVKSLPLFGISKKIYKGEVFPPESDDFVSDDNLFNYQAKVIKEVAAEESCVIIGRCADFILKDNPNVIRLFFYAPREDCITRVHKTAVKRRILSARLKRQINIVQTIINIILVRTGMIPETMISV